MPQGGIGIIGIGSYVPEKRLTNQELEKMVETSDEWIKQRTGVESRPIAAEGVSSTDLMVPAANRALTDSFTLVDDPDLDLILVTTSFPDKIAPLSSDIFHAKIGAKSRTLAIDVVAECAGFCWTLAQAEQEMRAGGYKKALVVSGDRTTAFTDYQDRRTCILFGDAAGAVVLGKCEEGYGLLAHLRANDSQYLDCIEIPAGGSALPASERTAQERLHFMRMPGGVQMLRVIGGQVMPRMCREICLRAGINISEVRWIIPHQANIRITDLARKRLEVKPGVIFDDNTRRYGNTSGSSVPLALDCLYRTGKLDRGDYIILVAFGAGFKFGANLIRWNLPAFKGDLF